MKTLTLAALLSASASIAVAALPPRVKLPRGYDVVLPESPRLVPRQLPAKPKNVTTVSSPNGYGIRYKEATGKVCETTPGVRSFSGYVDLSPSQHVFFWFFESRRNASSDPITLWLNGGPGSDSLIGLFEELGPCSVTENLTTVLNPYSWNEYSNMLFLSQPVGVGFSYGGEEAGSLNDYTGDFQPPSVAGVTGRWPTINSSAVITTNEAAVAAWEVIQAFMELLPQLDPNVQSKEFNLATESYGGHYGPSFYDYFYHQNEAITNGTSSGVSLSMNALIIINGIIDESIQAPMYPKFARYNTYGIEAINKTVYDYEMFALTMSNGCLEQVAACRVTNMTTPVELGICSEAQNMCRDNVEGPYYQYGGRGTYDIRHPANDPTPPSHWVNYVNQAEIQEALGVDLNYSVTNNVEIYYAFQQSGDFVYNYFLTDLEDIIKQGVRVDLIYGDADYICNWFGGEAVSLAVNYTHAEEFRKAGYTPMIVGGTEYGETREFGNFSFTRVYEAGHEVPYYQPVAALGLFQRAISGLRTSDGLAPVQIGSGSTGSASATHTESFVPLPVSTPISSSSAATASSGGRARLW